MGIEAGVDFDLLPHDTLGGKDLRKHYRRFRRRAIFRTLLLPVALANAAFLAFAFLRLVRDLAPIYFPPPDPPPKAKPEKSYYDDVYPPNPPRFDIYPPATRSPPPRRDAP